MPLAQSGTGGVLRAVPSAAVVGARRIFSRGGGKFEDAEKLTIFLVVTLKTRVFTVSTNATGTKIVKSLKKRRCRQKQVSRFSAHSVLTFSK